MGPVGYGSTHNFISNRLANMLRLPVIPTETFPVQVANEERLTCQGCYDKVRVELQGTKFYLTLFSLPLSGLDLVLGETPSIFLLVKRPEWFARPLLAAFGLDFPK